MRQGDERRAERQRAGRRRRETSGCIAAVSTQCGRGGAEGGKRGREAAGARAERVRVTGAVGTGAATNATAVLARVASTPLQPTVHPAATVAGGQSNGGGDWGGGLGTSLGEADCSATPSAGRLADAALDAGASYSTPVSMAQVRHRAAKGARARLRCLHSCTGRLADVAGETHRSPQARWPTRQRARRSAPPSPPARRCSRRSTRQREGGLGGWRPAAVSARREMPNR